MAALVRIIWQQQCSYTLTYKYRRCKLERGGRRKPGNNRWKLPTLGAPPCKLYPKYEEGQRELPLLWETNKSF